MVPSFFRHSDPSCARLWPVHGPHRQLLLVVGVRADASSAVRVDRVRGASGARLDEPVRRRSL